MVSGEWVSEAPARVWARVVRESTVSESAEFPMEVKGVLAMCGLAAARYQRCCMGVTGRDPRSRPSDPALRMRRISHVCTPTSIPLSCGQSFRGILGRFPRKRIIVGSTVSSGGPYDAAAVSSRLSSPVT